MSVPTWSAWKRSELLLLIGDAWDNDRIDGTPYEDIDESRLDPGRVEMSLLNTEDDDFVPKRLNYPVRNLDPGWHEFSFKAKDKGGRWSPGVDVQIFVAEQLHRIYLPIAFPQWVSNRTFSTNNRKDGVRPILPLPPIAAHNELRTHQNSPGRPVPLCPGMRRPATSKG